MQNRQHCPARRIGFRQSAGGQMTCSHCAMAVCRLERRERDSNKVMLNRQCERTRGCSGALQPCENFRDIIL